MAAFNKFNNFVDGLFKGQCNLSDGKVNVMLTNTAPVATNAAKADLAEIAGGNGYTAGGAQCTVTSSAQAGGLYTLVLADLTITAAGGTVGPFRYVALYNATSGLLIGFWDYGSSTTLNPGDSFTVDFDNVNGVLTLQ